MNINGLIDIIKDKEAKYYSYKTPLLCQNKIINSFEEEFHHVSIAKNINQLKELENTDLFEILIIQNAQNIITHRYAQDYIKKIIRQDEKSLLIFFNGKSPSDTITLDYNTEKEWSDILEKRGLLYEDFKCVSTASQSDIEDENEIENQAHGFFRAIFTIPIHKISLKHLLLFLAILLASVFSFFQYTEIPIIWKTIFSALSTILGSLIAAMIWSLISRGKIFQ